MKNAVVAIATTDKQTSELEVRTTQPFQRFVCEIYGGDSSTTERESLKKKEMIKRQNHIRIAICPVVKN